MLGNQLTIIGIFLQACEQGTEFDSLITVSDELPQNILTVFLEDVLDPQKDIESSDFLVERCPKLLRVACNLKHLFWSKSSERVKIV